MEKTPPRKRAPGAGRKPISQDGNKVIRARVTPEQYEAWVAMPNASEWLRAQLDTMNKLTSKEIKAVHSAIEMDLYPCASQERASEIAGFVRGLLLESLKYGTGMGTTPGMWEMASEALHGEKLPASLNSAIHALAEGSATVVLKQGADGEAHDVVLATVRVMTKALDELASACTDETGAAKAPDKKALMKARAMLPSWCANSLTKPAAKQT